MFIPIGCYCDMAASNFTCISNTYGKNILHQMKGCEFHLKQSIQRQIKSMDATNLLEVFSAAAHGPAGFLQTRLARTCSVHTSLHRHKCRRHARIVIFGSYPK